MRDIRVNIGGADTRGIYDLRAADARPLLAGLNLDGVDAVLISGTGLPSLPLIAEWNDGPPLLASNLCLAARLLDRLGIASGDPFPHPVNWHHRMTEATAA